MERIRAPFLILAIVCIGCVVLIEAGAAIPGLLHATPNAIANFQLPPDVAGPLSTLNHDQQQVVSQLNSQERPPGLAIPTLALLDSIALFTLLLMGIALRVPERLQGRVQGVVTLLVSLLLIALVIRQLLLAFASLVLMLTLLLSIPFGSIIYLIIYGSFNRAGADIVLSLVMLLLFGFAGCLFLAQQRFLQSKGLMLLLLTTLLGTILVSTLLGIVPGVLVSIADALAALVVGIITLVWLLILLVGAIISIIKILRPPQSLKA